MTYELSAGDSIVIYVTGPDEGHNLGPGIALTALVCGYSAAGNVNVAVFDVDGRSIGGRTDVPFVATPNQDEVPQAAYVTSVRKQVSAPVISADAQLPSAPFYSGPMVDIPGEVHAPQELVDAVATSMNEHLPPTESV